MEGHPPPPHRYQPETQEIAFYFDFQLLLV